MLGLACALWIAQGLLYFQFGVPLMVNPSKVRVSDEEVSFEFGLGTDFYHVSDCSWRVEGDRLYLTYYGSYLSSYQPMSVLDRTRVCTDRRINWIILVCRDGEYIG